MWRKLTFALMLATALAGPALRGGEAPGRSPRPALRILEPPRQGFFGKVLDYHGIAILAHATVCDEALNAAYDRLDLELRHLPGVVARLAAAKAELHIIGRHQVTTDLPEWKVDKHVPLDEYNGLTRDQRTRGMGGLITSCGEENLLRLPKDQDRYFGRDICIHEFAHNIQECGLDDAARARIAAQAAASKAKGRWLESYAGSNEHEYFAELSMWYFGTHGALTMTGPKPGDGPEGLKAYDPEAYALLDDLYSGRIALDGPSGPVPSESMPDEAPQDSQVARGLVAKLTAYGVGTTTLETLRTDAGVKGADQEGQNGWHLTPLPPGDGGVTQIRVSFRAPDGKDHSVADLAFKASLLCSLHWNNER